jgi:predicted small secreted protein
MFRKTMTIGIIGASVLLSACNTVRGAAQDVESVANCTEEMIKRGECKR